MSFAKTFSIFAVALTVLGCRPTDSESGGGESRAHTVAEIADAHAKFTISDLLADNNLSTDLEARKAKARKKLQETLLEADKLSDAGERNHRYKILAEQLSYESRFDEATEVSTKIQDKVIQDNLLEDIVRLQLQEIWQMYQKIVRIAEAGKLPTEIIEQINQTKKTAEQIDDQLRRARTFSNIALFRTKMNDHEGTVEMMNTAADFCRSRQENSLSQAQGLCLFANWFLHQENKEKTIAFCQKAENILSHSEPPFESLLLNLDISSIYILLGLDDSARQSCDNAEKIVAKISDSKERAMALLKLAESQLVIRMKDEDTPLAERILSIKNRILETAQIVATLPDNDLSKGETKIKPLSRKELLAFKNEMLRKIASMQTWGTTLEDAWETIEDIDSASVRDEALSAAIEMMIVTHSTEDIKAWVEEIADPIKKKEILQKINP